DVAARRAVEVEGPAAGGSGMGGRRPGGVARGRQATEAWSPDSSMKAVYRDRNLFISMRDGAGEKQLTTDGSETARIKYGTASWVYGEELGQRTAIWWSPDGTRLAYYRFDEGRVPDYYLSLGQTELQSVVDVEAYPKAGAPNPEVDVFVYDMATGRTSRMDVRNGQAFSDDVIGHYVYRVGWSPDGSELTLNRTNRRQN